jgi:hypothetical protein
MELLERAQLRDVFSQEFLIFLLRFEEGLPNRRPVTEIDFISRPDSEIL